MERFLAESFSEFGDACQHAMNGAEQLDLTNPLSPLERAALSAATSAFVAWVQLRMVRQLMATMQGEAN
jgi:hypothetical protein